MSDPTEQEIRAWCEKNPLPTVEERYWKAWSEILFGDSHTWREIHKKRRAGWNDCVQDIKNSGLWGPGRPRPQKYIVQDDMEGEA